MRDPARSRSPAAPSSSKGTGDHCRHDSVSVSRSSTTAGSASTCLRVVHVLMAGTISPRRRVSSADLPIVRWRWNEPASSLRMTRRSSGRRTMPRAAARHHCWQHARAALVPVPPAVDAAVAARCPDRRARAARRRARGAARLQPARVRPRGPRPRARPPRSRTPVALRRRLPLTAVVLGWTSMLAADQVGPELVDNVAGPYFANMFVTFTAGYVLEGRRLWLAAAIGTCSLSLSTAIDGLPDAPGDYLFGVGLGVGGPMLLGQLLRNRTRLNEALSQQGAAARGRAGARGGGRRAGGAHADRRRAARRRRARALRDDDPGRRGAQARRARPGPGARGVRASGGDRARSADRAAPAARRPAQGGRGARARAAAEPRARRRPRAPRGGGRASHRGSAPRAPSARSRPAST